MTRAVAVTGGTGFVGSALIEGLLRRGDRVKALARNPAALQYTNDVELVHGTLDEETALVRLSSGTDAFINCAGVTHARRETDYNRVNVEGAARAARAAANAGARFVHISSMSARVPNASPYAASKRMSERAVADASGPNPWVVLRAPAIYGPKDKATLPYFKMVKAGIAAEPLTRDEARASILFVEDLVDAIIAALDEAAPNAIYEIDDGAPEGHTWREIGVSLGEALAVRPRRIRVPRPVISAWHGAARAAAGVTRGEPSVRSGQVNEFFHPDWVARDNLLSAATSWRARTPLKEGFAKTVRWYQENGLL